MDNYEAYRNAEKQIEAARKSGARELDLSTPWHFEKTSKLTELPESLGQLTQLQSLNLSNNELTTLPDSLERLTKLQSLNLSHNPLSMLPGFVGCLQRLEVLDLGCSSYREMGITLDSQESQSSYSIYEEGRGRIHSLPEQLFELSNLRRLDLSGNALTTIPSGISKLTSLELLDLFGNRLTTLPQSLFELRLIKFLCVANNRLTSLPREIGKFSKLMYLSAWENQISEFPAELWSLKSLEVISARDNRILNIPSEIGQLTRLTELVLLGNLLQDIPVELDKLTCLNKLSLSGNPLNPVLAAACNEGLDAVKRYLRAKAESQVVLNEAKLILIGEGEVGKSCLLGALRGDEWVEGRDTTHGIEIKPVKLTDPATGTEITLNGWDFGGQRVYRPTHQLFFSAPAVYLVVWKPREGPQQGFVKEWIKLVKHREPDAKIIVVATHGGPGARQPDIDRQEIWDLFGRETVIDFFHVQSRPPKLDKKTGKRTGTGAGIQKLRDTIAKVAASLPEVGRSVPKHWQDARETFRNSQEAYLPLSKVFAICKKHKIEKEDARLLLRICHRVGDLIHYEHDPLLKDIVVLKPDWLATAMSFVLDDEETREERHGLISFNRLSQLWQDSKRPEENRYPAKLHPIFLRLMERFDLSYRVAEIGKSDDESTSLIAQLVPDVRPEQILGWGPSPTDGDEEQVQICRIVDTNNQSATAEGLFYQLIVRLHKYSLGRADYTKSSHWQRGLVLEDDTGARAFLEHIGNDVRITVRSPYPERFLAALTFDVQWLVESFWKGIRCEVTVPCLNVAPSGHRCSGLFIVRDLIEDLRDQRPEQKCNVCKKWLDIKQLLGNAPASRPDPMQELLANFEEVKCELAGVRHVLGKQHTQVIGRFDNLDASSKVIVSKVEAAYTRLMRTLLDEAKDGPRLFSFEPVEPGFFDRPRWVSARFKLTLWCEHSRRPVWFYSKGTPGVYTIDLPREWLVQAAPFLKVLSSTLGLVLPVADSLAKLTIPEASYKGIEAQLALGKSTAESLLKGSEQAGEWLAKDDDLELTTGSAIRADGGVLRQLHAWLKEKDPTFGGLIRVQNKRSEFLWVHPQFEGEY